MQICESPFTHLQFSDQPQEIGWFGIAGASLGGWLPCQQPASLARGMRGSSRSLRTSDPSVAATAEQRHSLRLLVAEAPARMLRHSRGRSAPLFGRGEAPGRALQESSRTCHLH